MKRPHRFTSGLRSWRVAEQHTSETTSNMASVEEDFPRGGTAKKSAESKIVVQRTEVDNLFQSNEQAETKKRKGAVKDDGKKLKKLKTGKEKEGLTLNAAAKCVEILHIKNVKEGMLMLGSVKEVTDF
ncbi:Protein RRP5-like protein, partial [Nibea albiflora]